MHRRRDVGAATRERVEELLARYGFVRPWERDPATPRQIITVFRYLSGPYTLEVVRGILGSRSGRSPSGTSAPLSSGWSTSSATGSSTGCRRCSSGRRSRR
ncbi:hypothetical protein [Streptomyces avermitilis]|uniref:hypothetical protein n=1 Tax=Streptomyces avermitilis TaxID=33903 RepID=UPI00211993A4|nr:hypothetical protein [Streptomyces avermitilis]